MNLAGFTYPGHTEILAEATASKSYAMMLLAGRRVVRYNPHGSAWACDLIKRNASRRYQAHRPCPKKWA
jgi:hypothetical protein